MAGVMAGLDLEAKAGLELGLGLHRARSRAKAGLELGLKLERELGLVHLSVCW